MELLNQIMTWILTPVAGYVSLLHKTVQGNSVQIAVLNAEINNLRELHGREVKDMKISMERIFEKLDNIEQALRR